MTPLQTELHARRTERLIRMKAWQTGVPIVPIERVRPPVLIATAPPKAVIPKPVPVSPPPKPEPMKVETWFRLMEEEPRKLRVEHIQRAVALHYKIERDDLLSHRRTAPVMLPRQVAMYLAKRLTLKSLPEIGRRFGGRDHTTILHAVRKIGGLVKRDMSFSGRA
jgi:hypothetical protein